MTNFKIFLIYISGVHDGCTGKCSRKKHKTPFGPHNDGNENAQKAKKSIYELIDGLVPAIMKNGSTSQCESLNSVYTNRRLYGMVII